MSVPLDTLGWGVLGGAIGGAILVLVLVLVLGLYVYFALALMAIGNKLKYKNSWLAWIPIANLAMMLQLAGIHWAFVFLILIPKVGAWASLVLVIMSSWKIFEKRDFPGWTSLSLIIPGLGVIIYFVLFGIVAWKKK